jgi:hypothetical protein
MALLDIGGSLLGEDLFMEQTTRLIVENSEQPRQAQAMAAKNFIREP